MCRAGGPSQTVFCGRGSEIVCVYGRLWAWSHGVLNAPGLLGVVFVSVYLCCTPGLCQHSTGHSPCGCLNAQVCLNSKPAQHVCRLLCPKHHKHFLFTIAWPPDRKCLWLRPGCWKVGGTVLHSASHTCTCTYNRNGSGVSFGCCQVSTSPTVLHTGQRCWVPWWWCWCWW